MSGGEPAVVRLSHDLARNFVNLPPGQAPVELATHITKFWEPRMRAELLAHVRADDVSLDPIVVAAAGLLRQDEVDRAEMAEPSGG